jgi:hypothetical protein
MSRGTRHTEAGTLRRNHFGYVLEMEGGCFWVLDVGWGWKARKLVGRQVIVEGTRAGFNLLDVYRIRNRGDAA